MSQEPPLSPRAEQTRRAIVDAALRLFAVGGYDGATMRAIAAEAGVSVGNAYYYFGSKEHLIQAFYTRMADEHAALVPDVLAHEATFAGRLGGLLHTWVTTATPYHAFAGKLFGSAAEPDSPLSPFSESSRPVRAAAIAQLVEVVADSDLKVSRPLRADLPELLWLLQMGLVLFWVHDSSPGQQRTRTLINAAVPLVDRVLRLTRLPLVRGLVEDAVGLVAAVRTPGSQTTGPDRSVPENRGQGQSSLPRLDSNQQPSD